MNDALYKLIYLSRNVIKGDDDTLHKEITQILRSARKNNTKENITGALMFSSDYFAQILEGPHDKVLTLFEHIQQDNRHSEMVMLNFSSTDNRLFAEWAMAYVGEETALQDRFMMVAKETGFDPNILSGNHDFDDLREKLDDVDSKFSLEWAA
jgi:hypothetical protein